jgi:plastocyanin
MRQSRLLTIVSSSVLCGAVLAACTTGTPGWTYQPAPPVTPAPSVEASASPSASSASGAVAVSALALAFEQANVNVPAGEAFQIEFANNDPGTPHNIEIRQGDAAGAEVFKGEIFNGVATKIYDVPALAAGAYTFTCTVHPTMVGSMAAG